MMIDKHLNYSFANCLVTSSINKAAIVTFLVAFLGKGLMPPERVEGKSSYHIKWLLCAHR
jgi:hypothetical protein